MRIVKSISEARHAAADLKAAGHRLGFVPTMGALHEGHLSLVRVSLEGTGRTAVSIFINPTQFAPHEDFDMYPRDYEADLALLEKEGVHLIFMPEAAEIYPHGYLTYVEVHELQNKLEGITRPHFFRGVCTVVLKLLNIIRPDVAYFGQKDAQQALIVRRMVRDLNLDVTVDVRPIIRDHDGLALSSRNMYLNPRQRASALSLSRSLREAQRMADAGERDGNRMTEAMASIIRAEPETEIDYIAAVDPETLDPVSEIQEGTLIALAVFVGGVRLIDNASISLEE
jgi:pantoate--beta-alanine ligase